MLAFLGNLAVDVALPLAGLGCALAFVLDQERAKLYVRRIAVAMAVIVAAAVLVMEIALIRHDFSVKYVAEVGGNNVPLYYTIISLWGALSGSILFWAFLLSFYTLAFFLLVGRRVPELATKATGILLALNGFFLFVIAVPENPFTRVNPAVACRTGCVGPNPLLQNHWMMGVHPPLLYLGYVGLSVPFALAIASLLQGIPGPDTFRLIRRWALVPWIFLTLGIAGGMWWSYAVLGWGGYWSWDPVENASVMPWLVTTAFLHSLQVQERRQMLKTWTLSLVVSGFLLSILGTFLTRSGVLASVHSFTESGIGPVFLAFFTVALVGSLGLLFYRSQDLAASGTIDSVFSRETVFLVNNLLLVAITFTILLGTLFPLLVEAVQGTQISVGAPYFNHVAVPIAVALLFLMGIGPSLPWGASHLEELQYRLVWPVVIGAAVIGLLLLIGVRGQLDLLTFGLAGFVLAVTIGRILWDVRARAGKTGDGGARAARHLFAANPRRYGGYLAHIGIVLAVIGIAASQSYAVHDTVTLKPGQSASVDGYSLLYAGWKPNPESNRMVLQTSVYVKRGSEDLGKITPSQNFYANLNTPVVTPGIVEQPGGLIGGLFQGRSPFPGLGRLFAGQNPFEDVYVVPEQLSTKPSGPATLQVLVNPLLGFVWLGALLTGLGGFFALLPSRRRRRATAAEEERQPRLRALQPEEIAT